MSAQALDLRRSTGILRRRWLWVSGIALLGLAAGVADAVVQPPALGSTALVRIASSSAAYSPNGTSTLVVIASSNPVLSLAQPYLRPAESVPDLQKQLTVKSLTAGILSIRAVGRTDAEAENHANSVAQAFVSFVKSPASLSGSTGALVLQPAGVATGRSLAVSIGIFGLIGLLVGTVIGSIGVLAVARRDRRLRMRDDIADSIGVPVLASVSVGHPADATGWVKLLTAYEPTPVDAWRLRSALDYLGVSTSTGAGASQGLSLAVLSLASDPAALALGPQLAVFAASLSIRTHLVIGPQQDSNATAALRAACGGVPAGSQLRVTVRDDDDIPDDPSATLTVVLAVVDRQAPLVADRIHTAMAVIGVSAGAATANELARVAASAADGGRRVAGILVADPDSTDHSTGRLPQVSRPTAQQAPTHLTGIPTETRQWMTQRQL
jgi:capsular polysaccharide biosynthesis protein